MQNVSTPSHEKAFLANNLLFLIVLLPVAVRYYIVTLDIQEDLKNPPESGTKISTPTLGFQDVISKSYSSLGEFGNPQVSKKFRLLQCCKLALAVAAIAAVLVALSAISIAQSLNGISVSGRLSEYVTFGSLITAFQDERAISCIFLGTTK